MQKPKQNIALGKARAERKQQEADRKAAITTIGGYRVGDRVQYRTSELHRFNQEDVHTHECPPNWFIVTDAAFTARHKKPNGWMLKLATPGGSMSGWYDEDEMQKAVE